MLGGLIGFWGGFVGWLLLLGSGLGCGLVWLWGGAVGRLLLLVSGLGWGGLCLVGGLLFWLFVGLVGVGCFWPGGCAWGVGSWLGRAAVGWCFGTGINGFYLVSEFFCGLGNAGCHVLFFCCCNLVVLLERGLEEWFAEFCADGGALLVCYLR
ncbi:hypothetical protein U1Q18_005087 [Sarracenia purpurea var. burkii]